MPTSTPISRAIRIGPMDIGLELEGRRHDGTVFPVEINLSPLEELRGSWSRFCTSSCRMPLKFTPDKGRVHVRAPASGPADFQVQVEDTDVGIGANDMTRLFVNSSSPTRASLVAAGRR